MVFEGREGRQQGRAQAESAFSFPIRSIPKMANFDKAAWQHVPQETAQEFEGGECHRFWLVAVGRIAPAKGDLAVFKTEKPTVGDRDAMRVVSQLANHVLWSGQRFLGVDHPRLLFQIPGEASKGVPLL